MTEETSTSEPLSVHKALQQCELVQNMIDISISSLEGLRTKCATSNDLTQKEIRTLEVRAGSRAVLHNVDLVPQSHKSAAGCSEEPCGAQCAGGWCAGVCGRSWMLCGLQHRTVRVYSCASVRARRVMQDQITEAGTEYRYPVNWPGGDSVLCVT